MQFKGLAEIKPTVMAMVLDDNSEYVAHEGKKPLFEVFFSSLNLLGDPEVTANTYCKLRNLPKTDTQNYSTDLR